MGVKFSEDAVPQTDRKVNPGRAGLDRARHIRGARGGDRHRDRLKRQHKPTKALLAVAGKRKKELEIAGDGA